MSRTTQKCEFVERYGGVYEHSPWIAEKCWCDHPQTEDATELAAAMAAIVDASSVEAKLALIRAHPDLAGKLAVAGELTSASSAEQARAGLDQCSEAEYDQFQRLNTAYTARFDFPFIMAVRNSTRTEILAAFEARVNNTYEQEFSTAIDEIHKIARLRLQQAI